MSLPSWYRRWKGDNGFMPKSQRQGEQLTKSTLIPLEAQIALFFGQAEATVKDLQEGVLKLAQDEPIVCQTCAKDIWNEGHSPKCQILDLYKRVMSDTGDVTFSPGKIISEKIKI